MEPNISYYGVYRGFVTHCGIVIAQSWPSTYVLDGWNWDLLKWKEYYSLIKSQMTLYTKVFVLTFEGVSVYNSYTHIGLVDFYMHMET